jgi:MraZ protein
VTFHGTYEYAVDDRGRVPLPPRYRDEFRAGVVLVQGQEGCVEVYTIQDYEEQARLYTAEAANTLRGRRQRRGFFARSYDSEMDKQGRILVPQPLRQAAELNSQVVICGRGECLEIWNSEQWERELAAVTDEYDETLESREPDA